MIRHLTQLAGNMHSLYHFFRRHGYSKARALQIVALFDAQTKAAAACMAVLCLAIFSAIVLNFGPGGYFFNK